MIWISKRYIIHNKNSLYTAVYITTSAYNLVGSLGLGVVNTVIEYALAFLKINQEAPSSSCVGGDYCSLRDFPNSLLYI